MSEISSYDPGMDPAIHGGNVLKTNFNTLMDFGLGIGSIGPENNIAYHPRLGVPYIDFIPGEMVDFDNNPELLMNSYETAATRQLDSAKYILELVIQAEKST